MFFFFKQKTAYEMRISDWSSDVCSSDLKVTKFMDDHVYPNEERFHHEVDEGDRWQPTKVIEELKEKAKAQGLWNLFLPEPERGAGLKNHEYATPCEIMGRVHWAPAEIGSAAWRARSVQVC